MYLWFIVSQYFTFIIIITLENILCRAMSTISLRTLKTLFNAMYDYVHTQLVSVLRYIRFREPQNYSHFHLKLRPIMTSTSDVNISTTFEKSKSVNYNSASRYDRRQLEKNSSELFSPHSSIRSGKY